MKKLFQLAFVALLMIAISLPAKADTDVQSAKEALTEIANLMNKSYSIQSQHVRINGIYLKDDMLEMNYVIEDNLLNFASPTIKDDLTEQLILGFVSQRQISPTATDALFQVMKEAHVGLRACYVEEESKQSVTINLSADEILDSIQKYTPKEAAQKNLALQIASNRSALPRQLDENTIWTGMEYRDPVLLYTYQIVGLKGSDFTEEQMKMLRSMLYQNVKQTLTQDDATKAFIRVCATAEAVITYHYEGDGMDIRFSFTPEELLHTPANAEPAELSVLQMVAQQLNANLPETMAEGMIWTKVDYSNHIFSMVYRLEGFYTSSLSQKDLAKLQKELDKSMRSTFKDDLKDLLLACIEEGADFRIVFECEDNAFNLDYPCSTLKQYVK